ncbi:MAG: hypothetical protein AB9907_17605 [Flexilinea sp.]
MTSYQTNPEPEKKCPHLGLNRDLQTTTAYPSVRNYCHSCNPAAAPNLSHQREHCQTAKYGECPVFLTKEKKPLPKELSIPDLTRPRIRKILPIRILSLIVLIRSTFSKILDFFLNMEKKQS